MDKEQTEVTITEKKAEIKSLMNAIKFHKKYIFVDTYFEECDDVGPIQIYCYISKKRLGKRDVSELKPYEHEVEIGPFDDIRPYCGHYAERRIQQKREELGLKN